MDLLLRRPHIQAGLRPQVFYGRRIVAGGLLRDTDGHNIALVAQVVVLRHHFSLEILDFIRTARPLLPTVPFRVAEIQTVYAGYKFQTLRYRNRLFTVIWPEFVQDFARLIGHIPITFLGTCVCGKFHHQRRNHGQRFVERRLHRRAVISRAVQSRDAERYRVLSRRVIGVYQQRDRLLFVGRHLYVHFIGCLFAIERYLVSDALDRVVVPVFQGGFKSAGTVTFG